MIFVGNIFSQINQNKQLAYRSMIILQGKAFIQLVCFVEIRDMGKLTFMLVVNWATYMLSLITIEIYI